MLMAIKRRPRDYFLYRRLACLDAFGATSEPNRGNPQQREDRTKEVHHGNHYSRADRQYLENRPHDIRPPIAQQPGHQQAAHHEPAPDEPRLRPVGVRDRVGHWDRQQDDDRLTAQHHGAQPPHRIPSAHARPARSSVLASPAVTTEPVISTPALWYSPVSSASPIARSMASSIRAVTCTRSAPKIPSAISASSPGSIDRGEEFRVTISSVSTGSS